MEAKLYRSRVDRVAGGVASGLSEYLGLDAIIIRVIFILLTFFNGIGAVAYIILWVITPEKPQDMYNFSASDSSSGSTSNYQPDFEEPLPEDMQDVKLKHKGSIYTGAALIVVGLVFLLQKIIPAFHFVDVLPLVLIGFGILIVLKSARK